MQKPNDTQSMLQVIINGQSSFRQEMLKRFDESDKKFEDLRGDFKELKMDLTERMDKLGKQLAYLEDDTPNREEFDGLEKRMSVPEHKPRTATN